MTTKGIEPVVYGSLAYLYYTKDFSVDINDIDFLVPEEKFTEIIETVKNKGKYTYQPTDYHSLKVFKDGPKISFDGIDHYLGKLDRSYLTADINGVTFKVLNLESLKAVYQQGAENIPFKKEAYIYKLNQLQK